MSSDPNAQAQALLKQASTLLRKAAEDLPVEGLEKHASGNLLFLSGGHAIDLTALKEAVNARRLA